MIKHVKTEHSLCGRRILLELSAKLMVAQSAVLVCPHICHKPWLTPLSSTHCVVTRLTVAAMVEIHTKVRATRDRMNKARLHILLMFSSSLWVSSKVPGSQQSQPRSGSKCRKCEYYQSLGRRTAGRC